MRYLIIILLFIPIFSGAVTGEDVRFDWELGQPAVTDDPTSACANIAVARFDWVLGEPTVVFDATATCAAAAPEVVTVDDTGIIWFK